MNKQIYEEASEWLVDLHAGDVDAAGHERLDAWFRESPHHIRAFLELLAIWEDGADSDLYRGKSTDSLIAAALASSKVITLDRMQPLLEGIPQQTASGPAIRFASTAVMASWRSLAAASALFALLTVGFGVVRGHLNPTYSTSIGEERSIRLSDGSSILLNSRTRVRVRFSEHERNVDLLEGQSLFHVAKDPTRPFIVRSDSARVRAVGTEFDVYRKASGTTVTVVEGRVAVLPVEPLVPELRTKSSSLEMFDPTAASTIILVAGQQVTVTPSSALQAVHADVAAATAWTLRQLVFDSTPLIDVVKEFNRYNDRQLIVSDNSLEDFHVTGVFSSADPASLLHFLRAQRGIDIEETGRDIRISKK